MPTIEDFAACQGSHHKWDEVDLPFQTLTNRLWRYRLSYRCERCTTVRHDAVSAYGHVVSRKYVYPSGYKWPRSEGDRAPTKAEKRLTMIKGRRALTAVS